MVFTFLENALNLWIFSHAPVPHSKLQVEVFENLFAPRRKWSRKLWFALSKLSQKIWRLLYLYFVWFVVFLNVMTLQLSEWYLSNSVILIKFIAFFCNYDNLTLQLYQKKNYLNEGLLFICRFKVGSLPRMINKEVLAEFIYKTT